MKAAWIDYVPRSYRKTLSQIALFMNIGVFCHTNFKVQQAQEMGKSLPKVTKLTFQFIRAKLRQYTRSDDNALDA